MANSGVVDQDTVTLIVQWGPWLIGLGISGATAWVNTKLESMRLEIAERKECTRHLEMQLQALTVNFETWRLESSRVHERQSGDAKLMSERHLQNRGDIADVRNSLQELINRVNRAMESVPTIIRESQAPIGRRLDDIEEKVKAVKFFLDHAEDVKDEDE